MTDYKKMLKELQDTQFYGGGSLGLCTDRDKAAVFIQGYRKELEAIIKGLELQVRSHEAQKECIKDMGKIDLEYLAAAAKAFTEHHATIKAIESGEWVLVPREPTEEIYDALHENLSGDPEGYGFSQGEWYTRVYKAMLSASPKVGGEL
jgi:hypothetical protein